MVAQNTGTEAELIAEGWPYAMRLVSIFCRRGMDRDAIESDALLGLLEAVRAVRCREKFLSCARRCILNQILQGIRREAKHQLVLAEANAFERKQPNDPSAIVSIRDEAEFVRSNLRTHAHSHRGPRRLSATSVAETCGVSISVAARRLKIARRMIEGSLTCAN